MKKKDLIELRGKKIEEVKGLVAKKRLEQSYTQVKIASRSEKNVKKVKNLRKDLAQILTILKEKEIIEKEAKNEGL